MTLYILGAGGHGRVVADIAKALGRYNRILFCDDAPENGADKGVAVVGDTRYLLTHFRAGEVIVAVGDNDIRRQLQERLKAAGAVIATLIHPDAVLSDCVHIGEGTVIMPGVIVNNGAVIGKGVILNTASSVDHDGRIGAYAHISVGCRLAGSVSVGESSLIGAGAVVRNNIEICGECIVGAGAVVVRNITISGTYVGTPARLVEINKYKYGGGGNL